MRDGERTAQAPDYQADLRQKRYRTTRTFACHPVRTTSRHAQQTRGRHTSLSPQCHREEFYDPGMGLEKGRSLIIRIPVGDARGVALIPCTPAKARHLLMCGNARWPGVLSVQVYNEQEPTNQPLVAGVDAGRTSEGDRVVGSIDTALNLLGEARDHIREAVEICRTLRRAMCRLTRRRKTRARIRPVREGVPAVTRPSKGGQCHGAFRPVQVGKEHFSGLLRARGRMVYLKEGWQTRELHERYGLQRPKRESLQFFEYHAIDARVLAASSIRGTCVPTSAHPRQQHRLHAARGGLRKPSDGRHVPGLKRGTLVCHSGYGFCAVGGFGQRASIISVHACWTNARRTRGARGNDCRPLTRVACRSRLVGVIPKKRGKGGHPTPAPSQKRLFFPTAGTLVGPHRREV